MFRFPGRREGVDFASLRSIFWDFEFRKSVFLGTGHSCCIFWLSNECCIFKCFTFSTVFFVMFYSADIRVNTIFHHYHTVLNFRQMNRVQEGYFSGFSFLGSIFWICCQWQSIFLDHSEIPSSAGSLSVGSVGIPSPPPGSNLTNC